MESPGRSIKRRNKSDHARSSMPMMQSHGSPRDRKHSQKGGGHAHSDSQGQHAGEKHSHSHGTKKGQSSHQHNDIPCTGKHRDDSILVQSVFKTMNFDQKYRLFKIYQSKPDNSFLIIDQRKSSKSRGNVAEILKIRKNAHSFVKNFQETTEANFQSFVKNQEHRDQQKKQEQRLMELSKQLQGGLADGSEQNMLGPRKCGC